MNNILSFLLMLSVLTPRPEYPRPQFEREDWINLNGGGGLIG